MLIVRLMKRCNNNCIFCMVRDEMELSHEITFDELKKAISKQNKGDIIDFFGGEPTLYPHFIEALEYSSLSGYVPILATNGRKFADNKYAKKIVNLGINHIRTSIYGSTPEIHNFHTRCSKSFSETITGIKNLVKLNMDLLVNIVITNINMKDIINVTDLLISLGIRSIKFSSLIKSMHCLELVPNNTHVREYLHPALGKCQDNKISIEIEKSPLCLVPEYYEYCIIEEEDEDLYTKIDKCSKCSFKSYCLGIPIEQAMKYEDYLNDSLVIPFENTTISPKYKARFTSTRKYNTID